MADKGRRKTGLLAMERRVMAPLTADDYRRSAI